MKSQDNQSLAALLQQAGHGVAPLGDGLQVEATPLEVGTVAAENRIVLTDLRQQSTGLEDMFLQLTAETQRDTDQPVQEAKI